MNPVEILVVLFILLVLALGASRHSQSRDRAELSQDVQVVRDVALRYVNLKCLVLPPAAVTLARAAADLGLVAAVRHPGRWRILLTTRPGQAGPATALQYWVGSNTWQWVYLLDTYPAIAQTGHVHLRVWRRPGSPNRRGFQGLLEGKLCG